MKRSFILLFAMLISFNTIILSYASYVASITCEEGEAIVCFEKSTQSFYIEESAMISIYLEDAEYGEALVQLWNQSYPDLTGRLSFTTDSQEKTDLRYISIEEASFRNDEWMNLQTSEQFSPTGLIAHDLNYANKKFIEMAGEGFAFITNAALLETLSYSLEDLDQDGRIDAVDTYDEIKALNLEEIPYVISLFEPYAFYPYLSAFGWRIFESNDAYLPGFEKTSLLKALEWVSSLNPLSIEDETNWAYPAALERNDFGFSMVGSWMFVEELETKHQADWRVSAFPNVDPNHQPSSLLTEVDGFVISKDSAYPSASHELLRLIRSQEGLEAFYQNTDKILLATLDEINALNQENSTRLEFSKAFTHAYSQPMIAFKNDNTQSAFELYYDMDLMSVINDLYQQKISPSEAQLKLMMRSDAWLYEHERELIYDQYQ